jgi:ornithine cyclodeaminase/alanine dehydrogenase-like protein (mu-crystallin family)
VDGADIVCTLTASREPLLRSEWVKAGAHINAVGACTPTMRELDSELVARARLVADSKESCLQEPGDITVPLKEGRIDASHCVATLGQLLAREKRRAEGAAAESAAGGAAGGAAEGAAGGAGEGKAGAGEGKASTGGSAAEEGEAEEVDSEAEDVEARRGAEDVTLFESLGLAIEDLVAALEIYRRLGGGQDGAGVGGGACVDVDLNGVGH